MTLDADMLDTKVVAPNATYNFVVDTIFIWNLLETQIFI